MLRSKAERGFLNNAETKLYYKHYLQSSYNNIQPTTYKRKMRSGEKIQRSAPFSGPNNRRMKSSCGEGAPKIQLKYPVAPPRAVRCKPKKTKLKTEYNLEL